MRKVTCKDCGRRYDYDVDDFCPKCGSYNPPDDPGSTQLERELLAAINALGIGPQGFGGKTTCLGLAIEQMPTHVAGLPVAVNVSCHVTRRASAEL